MGIIHINIYPFQQKKYINAVVGARVLCARVQCVRVQK
jgi:hypothetical protein